MRVERESVGKRNGVIRSGRRAREGQGSGYVQNTSYIGIKMSQTHYFIV